jgi:hypothetical protein
MKQQSLVRLLALVATVLGLVAPAAHAQLFRAYLSTAGSDANPCTVAAPCRLLPAALAAVADGGEIWMLDSANYNTSPVSVIKSVTILAVPGVLGSVLALGGNAINVSTAGVKLALRNVEIRPFPGNANFRGVEMMVGGSLVLDGCNVTGFGSGYGVAAIGPAQVTVSGSGFRDNLIGIAAGGGATIRISDSHFTGNTSTGVHVQVGGSDPTTSVAVSRSVLANNGAGVAALAPAAGGSARLVIADSLVESNTTGIDIFSVSAATAEVSASGNMISRNATGVTSSGIGAKAILSGNSLVLNATGFSQASSGVIESAGNNTVRSNGTNVGSMTAFSPI